MYEIYGYPFGNPDAEVLIYRPGDRQALVLGPKLTREVSKGGSLVFTMPRDHPQYDRLQKMSTVVTVRQDGTEIWRGRILNHEADWYNRRVIYCEGALSYFNDSCITPFNYEGTLQQFLQYLVAAHNAQVQDKMKCFQLGTITAALGDLKVQFGDADKYGEGEDYGSTWDIIDKMVLKVFGGYAYCTYDPETNYNVLNYCDQAWEVKRQVDQDIQYGVNLLSLTEKTDTNDLFTRIYPVGNKHTVEKTAWYYKLAWWEDHSHDSDEDHEERYGIMGTDAATVKKYLPASGYSYNLKEGWIQNDEAVKKFGIIAKIREQDTDTDNETFAAGVQDLQQNYAMVTSYTVNAVDLVDAGYKLDRLTFASYARILSVPHSVDAIMLCTKLVEPFERPDKKEYTFGMTRRTLTDRQVANMGRTNILEEQATTSSNASNKLLEQLFAYKRQTNAKLGDISGGLTDAVKKMGDLQNQIDDNITSWFYAGKPTTVNEPAKNWTTDTVRKQHIGDLYYDKDTGLAYRYVLDNDAYSWTLIRDTGVAKALADAAAAQATADNKVRCFVTTPTPPYDTGDIWMQGETGDIMRSQTARSSGNYNAADWVKASKYTDDTLASKAEQDAAEAAKTATNFLQFSEEQGLIVSHNSLPGKKVQITNGGVKVLSGSSMVNITADSISITDGEGSCTIKSGGIIFHGIRNKKPIRKWKYTGDKDVLPDEQVVKTFSAQTIELDLSSYSSVMLVYDTWKDSTWFSNGGTAGSLTVILPVNGQTYSYAYPWNTVHWRTVTVSTTGITFSDGYERTSNYNTGLLTSFDLEKPFGDGQQTNNSVCRPRELYGFM